MLKGGHIGTYEYKERTLKTYTGTTLQRLPGMQRARRSDKANPGTLRLKALGSGCHTKEDQSRKPGSPCQSRKKRPKTPDYTRRTVSKSYERTLRNQRRALCRGARAILVKKKDELNLKGPLTGHFKLEVKKAVVTVINNSIAQGLTQKRSCEIFGILPRKFRRWLNPKPVRPRIAWNKILEHERDAIESAAWEPELIGKPVSHIFVHGHESGKFFVSFSTVYRALKTK